ncbi:MAG: 5-formyltetrahydrofolate cyclo-ligase [Halorientalis sp.]
MDKQDVREQVWDELEDSGVARFPYPPHDRIPNFAGAAEAADLLAGTDAWDSADVVKANPDAPQLPVRRAALRAGKTLYVAVPRLRDRECFLRLSPSAVADVEEATTVGGIADAGVPVAPGDVPDVDLVVSGSVAVSTEGARIGKGEGYSDLEFAILREAGAVGAWTTTATTVHERQVFERPLPTTSLDVPMDLVVTPERTVRTDAAAERPAGLDWSALDAERVAEIPVLEAFRSDGE